MADQDDAEKEKQWQESLERAKIVTPPLDPFKLLQPIRQIQEIQQRQAETGRIFSPQTPAAPRQAGQDRGAELLKPFSGSGSTPKRKRFWNQLHAAVLSARKLPGRHVSVDEHPGKGSVINVYDTSARRGQPAGACPPDSATLHVQFTGITFGCGCLNVASLGLGFSSVTFTDLGVNTGFNVPPYAAGQWNLIADAVAYVSLQEWFSSTTCAGTPDTTEPWGVNIRLVCSGGLMDVYMVIGGNPFGVFYSTGNPSVNGMSVSNSLACADYRSWSPYAQNYLKVATGGTATITW
jgi:hypothetical protein